MKVLLATGVNELDNAVAREKDIELVHNPVHYKEAIVRIAQQSKPDVVVLTAWLNGSTDIVDIVYELRSINIRVVFLAGTLEQDDPTVQGVAKYSTYDILLGEVTIGQVVDKIFNPTPASEGITILDNKKAGESEGKRAKRTFKTEAEKTEENKEKTFEKFLKQGKNFAKGFSLPKFNKGFNLKGNKKNQQQSGVVYIPHHVISVWSPAGGSLKSITAFNFAITAAGQGFDVALINFDFVAPVLDKWFKIPNTPLDKVNDAQSAGVMTFGEDLDPELATKMMSEYGWGIKFLPAGNKLGNLGTPDIPTETLEQVISNVYRRPSSGKPALTIIDTCTSFELAPTFAAFKNSSVLITPTLNCKQEREVISDQLTELQRLSLDIKTFEFIWSSRNSETSIDGSTIIIPFNIDEFDKTSNQRKPYCLNFKNNPFEHVLQNVLT